MLKDENEYARRAAVEVLNVVGTSKSVKYLLEVIADSDWWVRTRAADALGKIGGPRVVDAVLTLDQGRESGHPPRRHRDPEPDQGRARGRAADRSHQGPDWWVSERAVDALAEIGSTKALPRFIEMLGAGEAEVPAHRDSRDRQDRRSEEHRAPAAHAAAAGKRNQSGGHCGAREARRRTARRHHPGAAAGCLDQRPTATISQAVARAMQELDNRFSTQQIAANQRAEKMQEPAKTLLIDNQDIAKVVKENEATAHRPSWTSPP